MHRVTPRIAIGAGLLSSGVLAALSVCSKSVGLPLLLASFGPTRTLLFAFPMSHFSRARNVLGSYVMACLLALLALRFFGTDALVLGIATGLCISLALATRLMHPPAMSLPLVVLSSAPGQAPGWELLGTSIAGCVLLLSAAKLIALLQPKIKSEEP